METEDRRNLEEMLRARALAQQVEVVNLAMDRLLDLLYEPDTDGTLCNVDYVTGRFLVPAPWGSTGHKVFNLRRSERDVLRRYVYSLAEEKDPPLFVYDRQSWHLNIFEYPTYDQAMHYWRRWQMTVERWQTAGSM